MTRAEAMPVRIPTEAYERLKRMVSKTAREGWRSVGCPERDDTPTIASVLGAALEQFEKRHSQKSSR